RLDRLAATGRALEVHVEGASGDEREAARYVADLYTLCFAEPRVRGIVWHGFWDGEPGVRGGLLRQDFSPRPAYRYLEKLLHVVWHTRAEGLTDDAGHFRFRGFFGAYRVAVRVGEGGATVADFAL